GGGGACVGREEKKRASGRHLARNARRLRAAIAAGSAWRRRNGGLLPRRQRLEAAVPPADLAVAGQRVAADLRAGEPAPDGEIGQRDAITDQPVAAAEMVVEDRRH